MTTGIGTRKALARARRGYWRTAVVTLAGAWLLSACGGGGDASLAPAPPPAGPQSASVVTTGTISAFGSVIVNGIRYETGAAQVEIEGRPGTLADLRVGDVVELKGRRGPAAAVAERILRRSAVRGPITAMDATTNRLMVLGQTVLVTAATSFGDSLAAAGYEGLRVGDVIEVRGIPNASAQIEATRIEPAPAGAPWKVVGRATAVDAAATRLSIAALVVDWSRATLTDFPGGAPRDGDFVEARGTSLDAQGRLVATALDALGPRLLRPTEASGKVEVEGHVTRFVSATDFDVAGRRVTTNAQTVFQSGTASDLRLDARVEVEGRLDAAGVLVAMEVEFRRRADVRIAAPIEALDAASNRLTVLGIEVSFDALTRFEDRRPGRTQFFRFADLRVGDLVEVRGFERPAASNRIVAVHLERLHELRAVRLRAPVRAVERPRLTVLSAIVTATATTRFEGDEVSLTADQFFALALPGQVVDVRGTLVGGGLTATHVEIDDVSGKEEVEGFVTRFVSATDFDVASRRVTTNAQTVFEDGTARDLRLDVCLEVEGRLDAAGVLVATEVGFPGQEGVRIAAPIEALDAANNRLTVLGIEVSVDAATRLVDRLPGRPQSIRFADLRVGDLVEVRGYERPATSNRIVAVHLERLHELRALRLRAPVRAVERPRLTVLSVTVTTTATTLFERGKAILTADQFFALARPGQVVDLRATLVGGVLTVTRVEIDGCGA